MDWRVGLPKYTVCVYEILKHTHKEKYILFFLLLCLPRQSLTRLSRITQDSLCSQVDLKQTNLLLQTSQFWDCFGFPFTLSLSQLHFSCGSKTHRHRQYEQLKTPIDLYNKKLIHDTHRSFVCANKEVQKSKTLKFNVLSSEPQILKRKRKPV